MKTLLYIDPDGAHQSITELRQACVAYKEKHPNAMPGHFIFRGEAWQETANGYRLSFSRSIRVLPLILRNVPLHLIEVEDTVEDPHGNNRLAEGIYEVDGVRAEVDSYVARQGDVAYLCYTIKIEGRDLPAINELYAKIRQSKVAPTIPWDLVAPDH